MRSRLWPVRTYQVAHAIASARSLVPRLRKRTREICIGLPVRRELAEKEVAERLGVEVFLELAGAGERDRAALLRDQDREGVGLLADADGGAVPGSEALGESLFER